MNPALQARVDRIRDEVSILDVVGVVVKLRKGSKPRGQCPFHGSKSDSLMVDPAKRYVKCWGCDFHGDVIRFVREHYGLSFLDALEKLEQDGGLGDLKAAPARREKVAQKGRARDDEMLEPVELGRWIWRRATAEPDKVRIYLRARGIPDFMLGDGRLVLLRFCGLAPISAWPLGAKASVNAPPRDWPRAPAMAALMQAPPESPDGEWQGRGVHATFLAADLSDKMRRRRADGGDYPPRKMLGPAGGAAVLLPGSTSSEAWLDPACALFVGEGIETVLRGMAIAGAPPEASGLAVLSLGNLQGHEKRWRNGAWPLFAIEQDPARAPALAFRHLGPVTILVDADMKPLRGSRDQRTGAHIGELVAKRRGERPVRRAITTAERAEICAQLAVKAWRAKGCRHVTAMRPPMGHDFGDVPVGVAA